MKVLWLSNETPDRAGQGGQRRQYFQIRSLARDGHEVTLATLEGPQRDSAVRAHSQVFRLDHRIAGRVPNPYGAMKFKRNLGRDWDRVVVAHSESWPVWRRFATPADAPVLVDMHNVLSAWHMAEGRHDEARRWRQIESAILREVDVVTVCTQSEREKLNPASHSRVVVLPHGIDPMEWHVVPTPAEAPG